MLAGQGHSHPLDSQWVTDKERQLSESQGTNDKTDSIYQWPEDGGRRPSPRGAHILGGNTEAAGSE